MRLDQWPFVPKQRCQDRPSSSRCPPKYFAPRDSHSPVPIPPTHTHRGSSVNLSQRSPFHSTFANSLSKRGMDGDILIGSQRRDSAWGKLRCWSTASSRHHLRTECLTMSQCAATITGSCDDHGALTSFPTLQVFTASYVTLLSCGPAGSRRDPVGPGERHQNKTQQDMGGGSCGLGGRVALF